MTIQENIPLAPYTTFKVGGNARYFVVVQTLDELKAALEFARARGLQRFVLGGGSNVVIADAGFPGLVIKMELKGIERADAGDSVFVSAMAGESWDGLVAKTVEWGLWGIENLSWIPGTVGAAPVQNIGAYGTEVMNVIDAIHVIDLSTGQGRIMSNAECRFSYRDSIFKTAAGKDLVIVSVRFRLSTKRAPNLSYKDLKEYFAGKPAPTQLEIRDAVIAIRKGKFPDINLIGTAGSFWKNPIVPSAVYERLRVEYPAMPSFPVDVARVKVPLAWILDNVCKLKGFTKGNVGLFERQPIVLVAKRGATFAEISAFEREVAAAVKAKTGIDIEREVGLC